MYHAIEDQEKNPDSYILTQIDPSITEDECHDLLTKPRQTQRTIGFYLKKVQGSPDPVESANKSESSKNDNKSFTLTAGSHGLERELNHNKGFWVGKPQNWAHLTYKLWDKYTVNIPQKSKKGHGIFYRPEFLELDYHIKLANAGLLYSDEEISDSEEEVLPDETRCIPLKKIKYKICDPCKSEKVKKKKKEVEEKPPKDLIEELIKKGEKPKFKKIPTGCQCDFLGEHNRRPGVWDNPFDDRVDMLRQHEMNKYMKPFKTEILKKNYELNPPVKFMAHEFGMKRTFPVYFSTNL